MIIGLATIVFLIYGAILLYILKAWETFGSEQLFPVDVGFSIILPVRNEEQHITDCLLSILAQIHSRFEIIVVNDHSTDRTTELVQSFIRNPRVRLYDNLHIGKKSALHTGIVQAQYPWIVTIDADTRFLPEWLTSLSHFTSTCDAIVGPVNIPTSRGMLISLQEWDLVAMQGFTGAGITSQRFFMANGANFAFKKSWYQEVSGYLGNEDIASGDDFFLIEKFRKSRPEAIRYADCDQCVATTAPQMGIVQFFAQRVRWGAKMSKVSSSALQFILGLVWLVNMTWLIMMIAVIDGNVQSWLPATLILFKVIIDFVFLKRVGLFFEKHLQPMRFLLITVPHALYIVIGGLLSALPFSVSWKGRKL